MKVLRGLALDENCIGANVKNLRHSYYIRFNDVLQSRNKGLVTRELLIPPAICGRKGSADKHLVNRRVKLHPGKELGDSARVLGKELRKIRVLEVPDPVWQTEVAEIDDRSDVELLQEPECLVREVPVVAIVSKPCAVNGRAITQETNVEVLQECKVCLPVLVVAALLQLIDANSPLVDSGIAVFNSRREYERRSCHGRPP